MDSDILLLKKYISNHSRLSHCVSTANYMMEHASYYSIDKNTAYFCGLYHDIGKELSNDKLLLFTENFMKRGIVSVNYFDFKCRIPSLLHGVASAEILMNETGLTDIDIINAVCSHTLGGKGLSRLSKYTFMMDFSEPLRKHSDSVKIYKILTSEKNFDKAYYMTYYYQLKNLLDRKREICPETIDGYNEAKVIINF